MMAKYKLGVIGGMGSKATAVFYDQVIEHTVAGTDQEHIDMVILNHASLPDRTSVILAGEGERFLAQIEQDLRLLEFAGVSTVAIPCNTSHYFYDAIQAMTSMKIINMIEETVKTIYEHYGQHTKIGLLATNGTARTGIYAAACEKYNMELYVPDAVLQEQIMNIIYQNIKGDKPMDASEFEAIITYLLEEQGCSCVIIGCTELSCIPLSEAVAERTFDAMGILVEQAIQSVGKEVKRKVKHRLYLA